MRFSFRRAARPSEDELVKQKIRVEGGVVHVLSVDNDFSDDDAPLPEAWQPQPAQASETPERDPLPQRSRPQTLPVSIIVDEHDRRFASAFPLDYAGPLTMPLLRRSTGKEDPKTVDPADLSRFAEATATLVQAAKALQQVLDQKAKLDERGRVVFGPSIPAHESFVIVGTPPDIFQIDMANMGTLEVTASSESSAGEIDAPKR